MPSTIEPHVGFIVIQRCISLPRFINKDGDNEHKTDQSGVEIPTNEQAEGNSQGYLRRYLYKGNKISPAIATLAL